MNRFATTVILCAVLAPCAWAINGEDLVMRSSGGSSGVDWVLDENGYVGTYIQLSQPGEVQITVDAAGQADGGAGPQMNIVVADTKAGFEVGAGFNTYQHTFSLPAGTHFVRTEFNNDVPAFNRELTIRSFEVAGATVDNDDSDGNALAAADTYIQNYRRGAAGVQLVGAAPGTEVAVRLKRHAFNFGTAVGGGMGINSYLGSSGTTAANFQQALVDTRINALTPENAGKWQSNASSSTNVNMSQVDQLLDFAEDHNMRARMHNLIWGSQQPGWVNTLLGQAGGGNQTAIDALRTEISERIDYYVGDSDGNQNDGDRARRYVELDVYNESVHTGVDAFGNNNYWDIFGVDGIAEIHAEVAEAVAAAGASTTLFVNEYNVLQDSGDDYGNWFRRHIEDINNAGSGQVVTGIGIQSYENNQFGDGSGAHNPSRKMQSLQNLSILGLPIVLTEFGVKDPTSEADAAQMMEETMRIVFGTPDATGFFMWGIYRGDIFRGAAALYRADWSLSPAGELWIDLMTTDADGDPNDDWDTDLVTTVNADGTIDFTGFYGDYEITIGGETHDLLLAKGDTVHSLVVAAGDYNANGVVDAADYTMWRDTLGSTDDLRADGNGDEVIDMNDYDVWKSLFGTTYSGGAGSLAASVPEPTSATLVSLVGCCIAGCWRRRRSMMAR
jgi:GH35 family endo-1,4-beta-xylanase